MKSLAVLFPLTILCAHALDQSLVDEMNNKVHSYGVECVASENVPEEDVMGLLDKKPPTSHEGKCALFCITKKFNIMTPDGSFAAGDTPWLEKAKVDDPDFYEKLQTMYKKCEQEVGNGVEDLCEKAAKLTKCAYEASQKNGIYKYFS